MDMPMMDCRPSPMGLTAILQAAATELMHLSTVADGLGVCQAGQSEQWQALDRMSQHLGELATFLSAVSCAMPDFTADLGDALAAVRVGRLVDRLTSNATLVEEEDPGELELFDA